MTTTPAGPGTMAGMTEPAELPIRYAHCCDTYDRHPRVRHIVDMNDPSQDKLYHYDGECTPAEMHAETPALDIAREATAAGTHGDELRELMTQVAQDLPEAPADTEEA